MAKKSIRNLNEALQEHARKKAEGGRADGTDDAVVTGPARVTSPLESPANLAALRQKQQEPSRSGQRTVLPLPVSHKDIACGHMELDPLRCFPSPLNPREQSLLSLDDPNVSRLKHSIEMNGQRDPVLARPVLGKDGQLSYEVIYGTTRLFVCRALTQERGETFALRAWVGDIPDADVRQLARSENQDRRNLSAWEIARDIKANYDSVYKGKTYDFIAEQEGISRGSVGNYLQLAQLPKELVALVVSPQEITLRSGLQLMSLVQPLPDKERDRLLQQAANEAPFATSNDLLKTLKGAIKSSQPVQVIPKKSALEITGRDGQLLARATAHRSESGQYKLDLFQFGDDDVHALLAHIRKIKGA